MSRAKRAVVLVAVCLVVTVAALRSWAIPLYACGPAPVLRPVRPHSGLGNAHETAQEARSGGESIPPLSLLTSERNPCQRAVSDEERDPVRRRGERERTRPW